MKDTEYLNIAKEIAAAIKRCLMGRLREYGYSKPSLVDAANLKSSHWVDEIAALAALEVTKSYNAALYVESFECQPNPFAEFSIYIDPLDGSLNWERGVGDPAVVIACSRQNPIKTLDDLEFSYVEGLRSGDRYWTEGQLAYYQCALTGGVTLLTPPEQVTLKESTAYLKFGYGGSRAQLAKTERLLHEVKDVRAFDNTGIELCEIARGATDLMIDARGLSDGFNLIAWPILRAAGGGLWSLEGDALSCKAVSIERNHDYIAATHEQLAMQAVKALIQG